MRYVSVSELIYINGRVLNNARIMTGKQKVRDVELLQAAAQRPEASAFGQDAYATLPEKVAALFHSVARNHPFTDGNKRTATVAAIFMCEVNGFEVNWEAAQALDMIVAVAEGQSGWEVFAGWLPLRPTGIEWDADIERDKEAIDAIMSTHQWLLHELERR